jgi:glycosyltransferase involved in cell wall biosynthesis
MHANPVRNEIYPQYIEFARGLGVEPQDAVTEPLISVVIPMYNAEKFIHRTIDSILVQQFRNFEVIIVDDGSTDSSIQIVSSIMEYDKRVRLISNGRNRGVLYSRVNGVRNAIGKYIHCMDADDDLAGPAVF